MAIKKHLAAHGLNVVGLGNMNKDTNETRQKMSSSNNEGSAMVTAKAVAPSADKGNDTAPSGATGTSKTPCAHAVPVPEDDNSNN